MSVEKITERRKTRKQLQESGAQKRTVNTRSPPLYNEIDSHKWASKMEIFRILSS